MNIDYSNVILLLAAVAVVIVGVARATRLVVHDHYPPVRWFRSKWDHWTRIRSSGENGPWALLVHCHYCAAPYIMVVALAWGYFSSLHWTWWAFWGWLALSYAASILVSNDGDE